MKKLLLFVLYIICIQVNSQIQVSTLTSTFKGSGGVTIDNNGIVYIGDFGDFLSGPDTDGIPNNVMQLDTDLNLSILANDFTGASGNEFDSNGVLYQADIRDNAVYSIVGGSRVLFSSTGLVLPVGIAFDSNDNLFVCNCGNNTIRKITPGGVSTLFSSGSGLLGCPNGMTIDEDDNLYIVNFSNPFIVKIEPDGTVTNIGSTTAGNGHIDYDQNTKNLYIASFGGNQLFYLNIETLNSGLMAGTGVAGNLDGPALSATFSAPNGIAVSKTGDSIYVNSSATLNNSNLNPQYVRLLSNVLSVLSTDDYEIPISKVKAYPNPAADILTLESNALSSMENLSVTLLDMKGRVVKKVKELEISGQKLINIDVSKLTAGIYFYSINENVNSLHTGKFIKN